MSWTQKRLTFDSKIDKINMDLKNLGFVKYQSYDNIWVKLVDGHIKFIVKKKAREGFILHTSLDWKHYENSVGGGMGTTFQTIDEIYGVVLQMERKHKLDNFFEE